MDIFGLLDKIKASAEVKRQNYVAKRKEFEEYKVNQEDKDDFVKYVQIGCDAAALCGEVLAYEEVLQEIGIFMLGEITKND